MAAVTASVMAAVVTAHPLPTRTEANVATRVSNAASVAKVAMKPQWPTAQQTMLKRHAKTVVATAATIAKASSARH